MGAGGDATGSTPREAERGWAADKDTPAVERPAFLRFRASRAALSSRTLRNCAAIRSTVGLDVEFALEPEAAPESPGVAAGSALIAREALDQRVTRCVQATGRYLPRQEAWSVELTCVGLILDAAACEIIISVNAGDPGWDSYRAFFLSNGRKLPAHQAQPKAAVEQHLRDPFLTEHTMGNSIQSTHSSSRFDRYPFMCDAARVAPVAAQKSEKTKSVSGFGFNLSFFGTALAETISEDSPATSKQASSASKQRSFFPRRV